MALVRLVSMPLAAVERPSIGLSLLAAALRGAGIETGVTYANVDFAERAGLDSLSLIGRLRDDRLVGEWIFSRAAFPDFVPDDEGYFAQIDFSLAESLAGSRARVIEVLQETRAIAAGFVDDVARRLVAERPRVVGATSMFHQRCASLALLRRVRELDPSIITMMGGANCEGVMGKAHFESFPWLDYVVCGEADGFIVDLVSDALQWGREVDISRLPAGVYGPAHRLPHNAAGGESEKPAREVVRPQVTALDALPVPEYHDYFECIAGSAFAARVRPGLLVETSRGCWWGARHHCTFCGLNGSGMNFRVKSPARVLDELKTLVDRHGVRNLELVDNILSMSYFDTLLPPLAEVDPPYVLFAETKANLKRTHVERLAAAGVHWIQPGIENLHDEVLRLMDKGSTGLINVQLMKWAREFGVHLTWFYLYGFPGERPEWYAEVASWMPLITHLQPPGGMIPVRIDRFSPYHTRAHEYGLTLQPNRSHAHVFPLAPEVLDDFAYFFESTDRLREGAAPDWPPAAFGEAYGAVQDAITRWHERFWLSLPDILNMRDDGDTLSIFDTRGVATARRHVLEGLSREVYVTCDQPQTLRSCAAALGADESAVEAVLHDLEARRLLLRQGERVLALAVRGALPALPRREQFPGGSIRLSAALGGPMTSESAREREHEKVSVAP